MIKKILIIFLFLMFLNSKVYSFDADILSSQKEALGIPSFISSAKKNVEKNFDGIDMEKVMADAINGKVDNNSFIERVVGIFTKELKEALKVLGSIIIIVVLHSILKTITDGLGNGSVSQVAYYVEYIMIITVVMSNFSQILSMIINTINDMVGFIYLLLPILLALMMATGSAVTATMVQPVLLFLMVFISNIIVNIIIPFTLVSTSLGIISKVSNKVQIDKIAKFFKSGIVWLLGIILTVFVSVLSLEGSLTSNVDGVTAKTAKAATSTVVPVVGKVLGDATDAVLGCSSILKNAVGIVGVVTILSICIIPVIKLAILTIAYNLTAALCQPIADEKITSVLSQIGDTFKILLAILISIVVMLVIGITLILKISNTGLMYR